MPDQLAVAGIIKLTEYIGFTIQPYLYVPDDLPYIKAEERLTQLNIHTVIDLPEGAEEFYNLSQQLESAIIVKTFSNKEVTPKVFFAKPGRLMEDVVKPYKDQRLAQIIQLLVKYSFPLFYAESLPNLYEADRVHIEKERVSTVLKFDRTDEGTTYTLEAFLNEHKLNLQDPSSIILTNEPCYLISRKRLFSFEKNINGKLLNPFLNKEHLEIPKRFENKYFGTFIRKIVNTSEIIATGFQIMDTQVTPQAMVSYEIDWQGNPCLILTFIYHEKSILANNPQKSFTDLTIDENGFIFHRYKRNHAWESEQKQILTSLNLKNYESCYRLQGLPGENQIHDMVNWLTENKHTLESKGIIINLNALKNYSLCEPKINIKSQSYNDYFDLHIIVNINDFEIPFTRFKANILNNEREYKLPSGEIFLLPKEWFEQYHDLFIHASPNEESLRLKKHHYKIFNSLTAGPEMVPDLKPSQIDTPLPTLNNVELRPYQISGYRWLIQLSEMGFGGILADDMGLGKTLQVIAMLAAYYSDNSNPLEMEPEDALIEPESSFAGIAKQLDIFNQPELKAVPIIIHKTRSSQKSLPCSLIVMPTSLIHNWVNEINKFAPYLNVLVYTGSNRSQLKRVFRKYNILLTTYGTLRNDIEFLSDYTFAYTILDESQQIKNPYSKTAQAVFDIQSQYRFALTGTPVENGLTDLWSQMNFVNPGLLGDLNIFNTYYAIPLAKDPESAQAEKLLSMIEPFVLRRTKENVAPELPILTETVSYCIMSEEQSTLYESEKSKMRNLVLEQLESGDNNTTPVMVLKALMKLRQIANHPVMVDSQSMVESGKYEEVTEKLDTIVSEHHRVLIFSSFVKHLAIFEQYCLNKGIDYSLLTGSTTNRGKIVTDFKNNEAVKVFLISLKAGGLGLNLTEADYVFMLDPWWNPAAEMQAINRAHRIGQSKKVFVYRFITKNTIEEKILILQEKKKALADAFIKPRNAIAGMSHDEILQLFE